VKEGPQDLFVFRVLASGSSGNAFLLRTDTATLLFEAGLRLPRLSKYLASEGIAASDLSAVLVSHEHRDHCVGAEELASEHGTPVIANEQVLRACGLAHLACVDAMPVGQTRRFGDIEVTSFPLEHDAIRHVGFFVRSQGRTLTIATDTGKATGDLRDAVSESDLVVIEANHDLHMLQTGPYPYHLRRRVGGPRGHLSNLQAGGIIVKHVKRPDVRVWLAHLSKENNTPLLALRTVRRVLQGEGMTLNVEVAQRDRPSLRWTGAPRPRQLSLWQHEGSVVA
jgi:phosphoribosyl 1,2-cyclic phosphodiesterase